MPTLANYTWKCTTTTTEAFTSPDGPPLLGIAPQQRAKQVTTVQTADIVDGPQIPASRAPWVPDEIIVTDGPMMGQPTVIRRKVSIHGHYLKRDGTPSRYQAGSVWEHMGNYTGSGSLHGMPDWVRELVEQLEPADEGVLT